MHEPLANKNLYKYESSTRLSLKLTLLPWNEKFKSQHLSNSVEYSFLLSSLKFVARVFFALSLLTVLKISPWKNTQGTLWPCKVGGSTSATNPLNARKQNRKKTWKPKPKVQNSCEKKHFFIGHEEFSFNSFHRKRFFLTKQALNLTKCNLIIFFYGGITKFEQIVYSCSNSVHISLPFECTPIISPVKNRQGCLGTLVNNLQRESGEIRTPYNCRRLALVCFICWKYFEVDILSYSNSPDGQTILCNTNAPATSTE